MYSGHFQGLQTRDSQTNGMRGWALPGWIYTNANIYFKTVLQGAGLLLRLKVKH